MPFIAIVVFCYTCGIYSKYKVMYEQDKFDEAKESQIEVVTIQDTSTEDEDVTNDINL